MAFPTLPQPAPGEVLSVSTCFRDGAPLWGGLLNEIRGRREGDVLVVDGDVRPRLVEGAAWNSLHGGNVPAVVPDDGPAQQVAVLAGISVAYGGDGPLLIDLAGVPGRGVRVPPARLGEVLTAVTSGALTFDQLLRDMDVFGMYQGDGGRPVDGWVGADLDPDEIDVENYPLTARVVDNRAFENLQPAPPTAAEAAGGRGHSRRQ